MFTIKYRYFVRVDATNAVPAYFSQQERIDGPYASVSQSWREGLSMVVAHRDDDSPEMTYGPFFAAGEHDPRPVVFVMNDRGSTVAKYDL